LTEATVGTCDKETEVSWRRWFVRWRSFVAGQFTYGKASFFVLYVTVNCVVVVIIDAIITSS